MGKLPTESGKFRVKSPVNQRSLYLALARLEHKGWLEGVDG